MPRYLGFSCQNAVIAPRFTAAVCIRAASCSSINFQIIGQFCYTTSGTHVQRYTKLPISALAGNCKTGINDNKLLLRSKQFKRGFLTAPIIFRSKRAKGTTLGMLAHAKLIISVYFTLLWRFNDT